ncbi:MAG TPA: BON domain-containing protein [Gammaproteobacteria bacterium]|nr:BON domain-containing protein [Gammaproteobacteria bacterium]
MRTGLAALLIAACGMLAVTAGCASKQDDHPMLGQQVGSYMDDAYITTAIKTKLLGNTGLKSFHIHVETQNRVVTLSGTLPSAGLRDEAVRLAKSVGGVRDVVSELEIQAPAAQE